MDARNENAPRFAYRAIVNVQPTVDHPRYYETDSGDLHIWFYAVDGIDAATKVGDVLAVLPFEIQDTKLELQKHRLPLPAEFERHGSELDQVGLSLLYVGIRIGAGPLDSSTENSPSSS